MAEGDLITGAWQIELQGVLMVANCQDDENLVVTQWPSGFGVPAGRRSMVAKPLRHGMFAGPQYMDTREFQWAVMATGATWSELLDAVEALGTAFSPVPDTTPGYTVPMIFTLDDPDVQYRVEGIPTRSAWGYQAAVMFPDDGTIRFADGALCEFLATDPLIYENTVASAEATLGTASGGLDMAPPGHDFPHAFGTATSGAAICENEGNATTYPVITITAGVSGASGIRLLQDTTGEEWGITLTMNAGETLVIDMARRTVLLEGTADRAQFVNRPDSVWFGLVPGTNAVTLQASGTGTTALVEWRNARLM